MKKLLFISASALCLTMSANAAMVLVNFGSVATDSSEAIYNNITGDTAASGNARRQAVGSRDYITGAAYSDGSGSSAIGVSINGTGAIGNLNNAYGLNAAFTKNTLAIDAWNSHTGATDNTVSDYGLGGLSSVTVSLTGLVQGQQYSVFLLCGNSNDGNSGSHSISFSGIDLGSAYNYTGVSSNTTNGISGWTADTSVTNILKISGTGYAGNGDQAFTELTFFASGTSMDIIYGTATTKIGINAVGIQAVPEPSTYALAGGALALGVALAVRRRKRG